MVKYLKMIVKPFYLIIKYNYLVISNVADFFYKLIFGYSCPKCGTRSTDIVNEKFKYSRFRHQRRDGKADKRFKDNPLSKYYELSIKCENESCLKVFKTMVVR